MKFGVGRPFRIEDVGVAPVCHEGADSRYGCLESEAHASSYDCRHFAWLVLGRGRSSKAVTFDQEFVD